jgi:hypothetical protein
MLCAASKVNNCFLPAARRNFNSLSAHQPHPTSLALQALPPAAWISAIASDLPSVDVDSMAAYNQLLQESLILQPSLLMQTPQQVAASIVVLERCLRLSAVWLGPSAVSQLLTRFNPVSLAGHLSDLLGVWLGVEQVPHSFGQLWLEAPEALSLWDGSSFGRHLAALQQELPDMPIGLLLSSSSSVAGVLLSLRDTSQLQGHVVRHAGYLIIAPCFTNINVQEVLAGAGSTVVDTTKSGGQSSVRMLAIYGCHQQHTLHTGVDYKGMVARELEHGVCERQQPEVTSNPWSTNGRRTGSEAGDGFVGSEVVVNTANEPRLLMQLDIRPLSETRLMPVVILPPRE